MGEYLSFVTKNGYKWYLSSSSFIFNTHIMLFGFYVSYERENALFSIKYFQYSLANFMSLDWFFLFASYWWRFLYDVKRLKVSTFRRFLLLYEKEFEMSLVDSSAQFLSERWNFWQRWSARTSLFLGSSYQNNKKGKEARRIFASYLVVLGAVPSTFMAYFLSRNFP